MTDLALLYAVAVAAILLSLLAWIGLLSNVLGARQILAIATVLIVTMVLLLTCDRNRNR
jgi:hypothetical protein